MCALQHGFEPILIQVLRAVSRPWPSSLAKLLGRCSPDAAQQPNRQAWAAPQQPAAAEVDLTSRQPQLMTSGWRLLHGWACAETWSLSPEASASQDSATQARWVSVCRQRAVPCGPLAWGAWPTWASVCSAGVHVCQIRTEPRIWKLWRNQHSALPLFTSVASAGWACKEIPCKHVPALPVWLPHSKQLPEGV